jgi:hypothetical protein
MEESNIQPVHSPVTVCGDIHGKNAKPASKERSVVSDMFASRSIL